MKLDSALQTFLSHCSITSVTLILSFFFQVSRVKLTSNIYKEKSNMVKTLSWAVYNSGR